MVIGNLTALFSLDSSNFSSGLKKVEKETEAVTNRMEKLNSSIKSTVSASGGKLLAFVSAMTVATYQLNKRLGLMIANMESLNRQLKFITGSADEAGKTFDFLAEVSERLGVSLEAGVEGFNKLAVSAKNSNLTMEQVKDIYEGVIEAAAVLGLSTDQVSRTFLAFEQMITSTVIRSQELNLQLADALPGSLSIMAKALGVTTKELRKMLEEGQLITSEVLPKFIKTLREEVAPGLEDIAGSMQEAMSKMESAWTRLKLAVADGAVADAVKTLTKTFAFFIGQAEAYINVVNSLWKQIKRLNEETNDAKLTGTIFYVPGSAFDPKIKEVIEEVVEASTEAQEVVNRIFTGVTDEIAEFDKKFGKLIKEVSEKGQAAAMKPLEALKFRLQIEQDAVLDLLKTYKDEREKSLKESLKDDERYGKALEALYKEYGEAVLKVMESFGVQMAEVNKKIFEKSQQETRDALEKQWGSHVDFVESALMRLTDALGDWVTGTEVSWRDLLDDMGKQLTKFALQVLFLEPIMRAFRAAVLGGGGPINAFAGGGVISEPVMGIGLRTGERYSLGEQGPETVTPAGASARDVTVNISAVDSKSLVSLMRENPGAVTTPIVEALNAGDRGLTASLRGSL